MNTLRYRGRYVDTSRTAEIPKWYLRNATFSRMIQEALDSVPPWRDGYGRSFTADVPYELQRTVVGAKRRPRLWGIHQEHTATNPQPSPFVMYGETEDIPTTRQLTLSVTGTVKQPVLVRVYTGSYRPPLPWQRSAQKTEKALRTSLEYWTQHAYVYGSHLVSDLFPHPPTWYLQGAR